MGIKNTPKILLFFKKNKFLTRFFIEKIPRSVVTPYDRMVMETHMSGSVNADEIAVVQLFTEEASSLMMLLLCNQQHSTLPFTWAGRPAAVASFVCKKGAERTTGRRGGWCT
jgi:hypothetical protein